MADQLTAIALNCTLKPSPGESSTEVIINQILDQRSCLGHHQDSLGHRRASGPPSAPPPLGATVNKKWLILPGTVLAFLFQHSLQGWCPPVPIFRRFGIRTRKEIELEKHTLKALRGDFDFPTDDPTAEEALDRATR